MLPLITLFVLLGGLKWSAHWAALCSLAVALVVALAVYSMPVGQAFDSALLGAVFGLFPIMWIVWNAIWIYNMTEATGHFAVLRRSFGRISDDQRVQAVIIAFCFGALLEALAGFGTPVAITAVMLIALGFKPIKAAAVALVANTAPVAFGAIAIPIITLAEITGLPKEDLGAMVGRQTPVLALFVPLILVGMVDGLRGVRQAWPAAIVGGFVFAVAQFACSNYISVELTDIVASLLATGAIVALLQVWQPSEPIIGEAASSGGPAIAGAAVADPALEAEVRRKERRPPRLARRDPRRLRALPDHHRRLRARAARAGQDVPGGPRHASSAGPASTSRNADGEAVSATTFKFNWAERGRHAAAGLRPADDARAEALARPRARGLRPDRSTSSSGRRVTVAAVLALAYVMNLSGQTITLGLWIAGAGGILAFLSSIIGWLGVAVTGSDTSSNSLFGALQVSAAQGGRADPTLLAAANSSGGVLGKMISPQNLAIGAAAVGLGGREGELFRRVLGWSLVLLLIMCVLVYLQSTPVLSWMVVG